MPPNELEIANSPQSEEVTEVGILADTSSHNDTADKLSIQQKDAAQLNFVSQLFDIVSGCARIDMTDRVREMSLSNGNFDYKFTAFTKFREALQFAVVFFNDDLVRN